MNKRYNALIIIVIVETIVLLFLAIAFYKFVEDEECECNCSYMITGIIDDKEISSSPNIHINDSQGDLSITPKEGDTINSYIIWDEELRGSFEFNSITFGNTDPPSVLSWEDGYLHFEGNVDEAAREFIDSLIGDIELFCDNINCEQCPACGESYGCACDCPEFSPEGKSSNEYNEIERKYVDGWNDGYKIGLDNGYEMGLADRPSDEEICGALIHYEIVRPYMLSGTPMGTTGTSRLFFEMGYEKGYSYGWNEGFTECEDICEGLLKER